MARADRLRPRLWMIFAGVGLGGVALSMAGLVILRVYDDQLVQKTEGELLAQGVVVAEAYGAALRAAPGSPAALPRIEAWPFATPDVGELRPVWPRLRAGDETLPPAGDPTPAENPPPDERAAAAARTLDGVLAGATRSTLAAIQLLDTTGAVVAASKGSRGGRLSDRPEVIAALRGAPASVLRLRNTTHPEPPLESLSRSTGRRVFVALPVLDGERVLGAVVLSRTPMTLKKAIYGDRYNLSATALVLVVMIGVVALLAAALIVRPVRALVGQAEAMARGDVGGSAPIAHPVVHELARLSETLAATAATLHDRNEYIRNFAAQVSHEFKTPLSAILGAVELMRDHAAAMPADQRQRFLGNVEADARRLSELVHRLLELARADAQTGAAARSDAAPILTALAARASVQVAAPPGPLIVAVPTDVLDTVLGQLCDNARQQGATRVDVTLTLSPSGAARIQVADDGPGISAANRPRVFDPFFTTARERGGTGLGLPIARALLRAFGARLELAPDAGRGCTFVIDLPAVS